jgi:hypothetical protein
VTSQASHMNGREAEHSQVPALPLNADVRTPSPARMYDYYLGGKDNYAVDREAAERALSVVPAGRRIAQENRRFLVRAVTHLASCGIEQFIDLGTGIPTSPNVHEVARSIVPHARVVYVDNDPIVTVHNRALLESDGGGTIAVRGDIRYPLNILTNHELRQVIDFQQPVGILAVAVLHFVTDTEAPYRAVAAFRDRVSAGSCIAISHITSDGTEPDVVNTIEEAYRHASAPAVFRSTTDIRRFFAGFDLIEPGLVELSEWRGQGLKSVKPPALRFLAGVGRKLR